MNFHGLNVRCANRIICVFWCHYCGRWTFGRVPGVTLGLYLPRPLVHDQVKLLPCDHETHNHRIHSLKPEDTYTNLFQLTVFLSKIFCHRNEKRNHYHTSIPLSHLWEAVWKLSLQTTITAEHRIEVERGARPQSHDVLPKRDTTWPTGLIRSVWNGIPAPLQAWAWSRLRLKASRGCDTSSMLGRGVSSVLPGTQKPLCKSAPGSRTG